MGIEKAVFEEFGSVNDGYKGKVRSLALNLKSKSNPGLRESIVSGELPVTKLCKMSVEVCVSPRHVATRGTDELHNPPSLGYGLRGIQST